MSHNGPTRKRLLAAVSSDPRELASHPFAWAANHRTRRTGGNLALRKCAIFKVLLNASPLRLAASSMILAPAFESDNPVQILRIRRTRIQNPGGT